jgi:hypothetical protein
MPEEESKDEGRRSWVTDIDETMSLKSHTSAASTTTNVELTDERRNMYTQQAIEYIKGVRQVLDQMRKFEDVGDLLN